MHLEKQPTPVVLVAIKNKNTGNYLLIKRRKPPYKEYWGLVGGKWQFGESVFEAGKREVLEETGLSLEKVELKGIVSEYLFDSNDTLLEHFLIFVLYSITNENSLNSSDEGTVKWFSSSELQKIKLIPTDRLMFENFIFTDKNNELIYVEAAMKMAQKRFMLLYFNKK